MLLGPPADLRYKPTTKTSTTVIGVNIDLSQVGRLRLEHLDVCESDRRIMCEGDPETTSSLGISQVLLTRDLVENRIRGVAPEEFGGGEFYGSDQLQIASSSADNAVNRHGGVVPSSYFRVPVWRADKEQSATREASRAYRDTHSSSAIMMRGGPPDEIFAACSSVSFPPAEEAQVSSSAMEEKWISAIR
jgi:hypothetical protein